jgi:NTE family protein
MAAPAALARAWLQPWRVRPGSLAAAALPEGRVPSQPIADFLAPLFPSGWPSRAFWVCAVSLRDARRVVFGRDAHEVRVGDAVAASCAVPGVFTPVEIAGERFVDGGAHSVANLDLAANAGLDLVLVSSPMTLAGRRPVWSANALLRRSLRAQLAREAAQVRARGVALVAFQPSTDDLEVLGTDAMDPRRRAPVAEHIYAATLRRLESKELRERLALLGS